MHRGEPGEEAAIAEHRVNELDYFSLGVTGLARNLGTITTPKLGAVIEHLGIRNDPECYKEFRIGEAKEPLKRFSPKALQRLRKEMPGPDVGEVWTAYRKRRSEGRAAD